MVNIWLMMFNNNLVGGFNNLEKYEFVNGKAYHIYYGKNKQCSKPTTSYVMDIIVMNVIAVMV